MEASNNFDNRKKTLINIFQSHGDLTFSSLLELTGWKESVLLNDLQILNTDNIIDEYYNDETEKINYKLIVNTKDDLLTLDQRNNLVSKLGINQDDEENNKPLSTETNDTSEKFIQDPIQSFQNVKNINQKFIRKTNIFDFLSRFQKSDQEKQRDFDRNLKIKK